MSAKSCSVDHSQISDKAFCSFCGEKIERLINRCTNGHNMAAKLKFCTECGSTREVLTSSAQPTRVLNSRPSTINLVDVGSTQDSSSTTSNIWDSVAAVEKDPMTSGINSPIARGIAIGVAVLIIIVGVFSKLSSNSTTDVTVNMTLVNQECSNVSWGYLDIPGGRVSLEVDGSQVSSSQYTRFGTTVFNGCRFTATLSGVKQNGRIYTLTSGNVLRGALTENKSELSGNDWTFDVSLGGN